MVWEGWERLVQANGGLGVGIGVYTESLKYDGVFYRLRRSNLRYVVTGEDALDPVPPSAWPYPGRGEAGRSIALM